MFRCFGLFLIVSMECGGRAQTALSLRGSVLDSTGAGISGAKVRLETVNGVLLNQCLTGAKGEFILANLPSGNFSLVVIEETESGSFAKDCQLGNRNAPRHSETFRPMGAIAARREDAADSGRCGTGNNSGRRVRPATRLRKVSFTFACSVRDVGNRDGRQVRSDTDAAMGERRF